VMRLYLAWGLLPRIGTRWLCTLFAGRRSAMDPRRVGAQTPTSTEPLSGPYATASRAAATVWSSSSKAEAEAWLDWLEVHGCKDARLSYHADHEFSVQVGDRPCPDRSAVRSTPWELAGSNPDRLDYHHLATYHGST
jgi:hypothetical protein